jgi:Arc/MetJ-type ribon-helix-helix transcriptional regulator
MQNIRLTIRLPSQDIYTINMFLRSGEFSTRSEFIRRAIREYSQNHMDEIIKKAETMKKLQNLVNNYETTEEYLKK